MLNCCSFVLKVKKNLTYLKGHFMLEHLNLNYLSHPCRPCRPCHPCHPCHSSQHQGHSCLPCHQRHLLTASFAQLIKSFKDLRAFKAFKDHLTFIIIKDYCLPYSIALGFIKPYSISFMDFTLQIKAFIKIKDLKTLMGRFHLDLPFHQHLPCHPSQHQGHPCLQFHQVLPFH